mmetsp:Transcript_26221/g.74569  ORF Transcript_26221/g.74569 Transcript_26221/m.74569 type:complete len:200 (+) Transcript_26221:160-759(+)
MFPCRMCSENPFSGLFGSGGTVPATRSDRLGKKRHRRASFQARTEEEIDDIVQQWEQFVHPRAREYFAEPGRLREVLCIVAKCIDRDGDPVLGSEDKCVTWYGDTARGDPSADGASARADSDLTQDGGAGRHLHRRQAVFKLVKPGESAETVTYVNRVLAFTFAADDSFEQLMRLPKEPFRMSCSDQLCVHISHISLDP